MTDKPFDEDAYLRDYDKRLETAEKKSNLIRLGFASNEDKLENDEIVVTPGGAFKKKQVSNDMPKPQIFKLILQTGAHVGGGHILVHNKDRSWEGKLPMTAEFSEFFGSDFEKYVIATADASGRLHIDYGIALEEQHKF